MAEIFKAYDIRGVVPDDLDERTAEAVGAAFVRLTGASQIVTVHDMRTSSAPLAAAFARGVTAQGAEKIKPWGMIGVIVLLQVDGINRAFFDLVNRIYDLWDVQLQGVRFWEFGHEFFKFWLKNPL